jgi:hypothetical protein
LATDRPWYATDAPESDRPDVVRQVIVFRLRPVDAPPDRPSSMLDRLPSQRVAEVPVEVQNSERVYVQPDHQPYEAERREQQLVLAYCAFMTQQGSRIARHLIRPEGEAKPMFSDVYDATRNNLLEAKGTVTREAIRWRSGNSPTTVGSSNHARHAVCLCRSDRDRISRRCSPLRASRPCGKPSAVGSRITGTEGSHEEQEKTCTVMDLAAIVAELARGFLAADALRPVAVSHRGTRAYQPGARRARPRAYRIGVIGRSPTLFRRDHSTRTQADGCRRAIGQDVSNSAIRTLQTAVS